MTSPLDHAERKFLSVEEVGKILGVSRPTIFRRIQDGTIHSILLGKRRLIPVAYVRDFERKSRGEAV